MKCPNGYPDACPCSSCIELNTCPDCAIFITFNCLAHWPHHPGATMLDLALSQRRVAAAKGYGDELLPSDYLVAIAEAEAIIGGAA